jgi:integrase
MASRRRDNKEGSVWWDEQRGRWRGRYTVHGKEHFCSGTTKREVTAKLDEIAALPVPTVYNIRQAGDEWMKMRIRPLCRRSTIDQYDMLQRIHINPVIGDLRLEDVTAREIQNVISTMMERKLSTATMGHARKVIHCMYEWYIESGIVDKNPCERIRIPKIPTTPRRSLSPDEIVILKEAMKRSRWQHAVNFLLLTGLRRGELLALKWTDIKEGWITIERSVSEHMEESRPKSDAGCRRFRLPKAALKALADQKAQLKIEGITSEYVFPGEGGEQMSPRSFPQAIQRIASTVGIKVSLHELRHTFVSTLGASIDLKALQTILGHSKATHTLDIYGHLIDGALDKAAEDMDKVIKGKKRRSAKQQPKSTAKASPATQTTRASAG